MDLHRLIQAALCMQCGDEVHVQTPADERNALAAAVAIVDAEERTVSPIRRRKILQYNLFILHGCAEALFRVNGGVEAQHLELEGSDPEKVVRL